MKQLNYEKEHRKLWNWLAAHPGARKADYFKNWGNGSIPRSHCFACEVAGREADRADAYRICEYCPLGGESVVGCDDGLFAQWWEASSYMRRRKLALQIANLPWKEKEGVK